MGRPLRIGLIARLLTVPCHVIFVMDQDVRMKKRTEQESEEQVEEIGGVVVRA
jgi:hypothetical protein